jgi:Cys-rich repeat protein
VGGSDPAGAAGAAGGDPAGAGGTAGSSGGGQAGQKSDALYCVESADCAGNTGNKVCDTSTNRCVQCLPSNDECPEGQFCQLDTKTCKAGCKSDADCSADKPTCDKVFRICEQCQIDSDCPAGQLCSSGVCTSGCSDSKPCADPSQTCCDGACHALDTDVNHCGACGKVCDKPDNSEIACTQGQCSLTFCAVGFSDCNKDPSDGCEVNTAQQGACVCEPGTTAPCYDGPAGTEGVGLCKGGTKVCGPSGMGYLPGCAGQVLPAPEVCADGQDHDCNGAANDVLDVDGDGWNACNGDCCEFTFQCGDPKLVNPGAYDLPGDAIDDDCSGTPEQGQPTCDVGLALADSDPVKGANAMDICQTTQAGSAKWGIISAQYVQMNGDALPNTPAAALGYGIMENFGTVVKRQLGKNMLVLSSGTARTSGQAGYQLPSGFSKNYNTGNPQGFPVNSPSCPGVNSGALRDSVALKLRLKAPTNAKSVSFKFKFYTYEYPNFICSTFNDIFIAVMRDKNGNFIPGANPATGNISFDKQGNYLSVNAGFLEACTPGFHGGKQFNCPLGTTDLQGTGFETGAATDWLETIAPVNPGEEFELLFGISDAGDGVLDSTVLIDAFQWLATPSSGPSTNPAK